MSAPYTLYGLLLLAVALQGGAVPVGGEKLNKTAVRVVIVGAGVSGIGTAARLIENGVTNVQILEAEDRIGGRVHSVPLGEWTVDMGGHWVHGGSGNPVYDLAAPLGLVEESRDGPDFTVTFSDGLVRVFNVPPAGEWRVDLGGHWVHGGPGNPVYDMAKPLGLVEESGDNEGLTFLVFSDGYTWSGYYDGDTLDTSNYTNVSAYDAAFNRTKELLSTRFDTQYVEPYAEHLMRLSCTVEGCETLRDVSARLADDYLELNSSQTYGWKGKGYGTIIDLLLKRHEKSQGPPIDLEGHLHLNTEVTQVSVEDDGTVNVTCSDGRTFNADLVVVTVSIGVLKERRDSLITPPLSQPKKDAIEAIGFGTIDKVILRFPSPWWPVNSSGFELVWLQKDKEAYKGDTEWEKEILVFATERWSPNSLTAWLIGDAARDMERTPLPEVQRACMRVLRRFVSSTYPYLPEPEEVLRSTWGTNPHFRGSYSYRRLLAETHNVSYVAEPILNKAGQQVVFFAGEATHKHFFSTVHGALASGWREADRILGLLN